MLWFGLGGWGLSLRGGKRSAVFRFGVKVVWLFLFLVAEGLEEQQGWQGRVVSRDSLGGGEVSLAAPGRWLIVLELLISIFSESC
jgi:hypothetical protein